MKRAKQPPVQEEEPEQQGPQRSLCWETFFSCQRHPVLRSQLLTGLMAGTVIEAERVPTNALLDAVLISAAARFTCEAEVVDDYQALCQRTDETWARPDFCHRVFSSIHGRWANYLLHGAQHFDTPEERYIPDFVSWYLAHGVPEYFARELSETENVGTTVSRTEHAARKRGDGVTVSRAERAAKRRRVA